MITFTIPGQPRPKQRARGGNGRHYTPEATRQWEETVGWYANNAMSRGGHDILTVPLMLSVIFYREHERKADLDNLVKSIQDGMNGIVYEDDKQVVVLNARVLYEQETPRVEVEIVPTSG